MSVPAIGFRPVRPHPGRPVSLALVLHQSVEANVAAETATLAEQSGFDALWLEDRLLTPNGEPLTESWTLLTAAAHATEQIPIGVMFTSGLRSPAALAATIASTDRMLGGRLNMGLRAPWYQKEFDSLGIPFPHPNARLDAMRETAVTLRRLTAGESLSEGLPPLSVVSPQPGGPRLSMEVRGRLQLAAAAELADDAVFPPMKADKLAEALSGVSAACEAARRDPDSLGLVAEIDLAPRSEPPPTIEDVEAVVAETAEIGIGQLRVVTPATGDHEELVASLPAAIGG
jgi:alkanesulfonate monooxygenase SsuD/methylene tetrahydromethanopterin reductase-like flavin-dependent oxidoreductase (luciferase family)